MTERNKYFSAFVCGKIKNVVIPSPGWGRDKLREESLLDLNQREIPRFARNDGFMDFRDPASRAAL